MFNTPPCATVNEPLIVPLFQLRTALLATSTVALVSVKVMVPV